MPRPRTYPQSCIQYQTPETDPSRIVSCIQCNIFTRDSGSSWHRCVKHKICSFSLFHSSQTSPGATQPRTQWVPVAASPRLSRQGRGAGYSPPYSAKIKNGGAIPPLPIRLHGVVQEWRCLYLHRTPQSFAGLAFTLASYWGSWFNKPTLDKHDTFSFSCAYTSRTHWTQPHSSAVTG
jgi:hypothetical protein